MQCFFKQNGIKHIDYKDVDLLKRFLSPSGKILPAFEISSGSIFNETELVILELICNEMTTQEIADKLFKSRRTIESARTLMMNKVGARNVVGLVMYAIQNGIVKSK